MDDRNGGRHAENTARRVTPATKWRRNFSSTTSKILTPRLPKAFQLDSRPPGGRKLHHVGPAELSLERSGFRSQSREGMAADWPIRYKDIAPWYDYVEDFVGISGQAEGLPQLPDGKFLPPMEMNCAEQSSRMRGQKFQRWAHDDHRPRRHSDADAIAAAPPATTAGRATAAASRARISAAELHAARRAKNRDD